MFGRTKNNNYFEAFIKSAEFTKVMAENLEDLFKDMTDLDLKAVEIHKIEHEADLHLHSVLKNLNKEFITPLERDDILSVMKSIDNITDCIEDIPLKLSMYGFKEIKPEMVEFSHLITQCCEELIHLFDELKNFKHKHNILAHIIEINDIEEIGDSLFYNTMHKIFSTEKDAVKLIILKDVFETMEGVLDHCEDVADMVEEVLIRNS